MEELIELREIERGFRDFYENYREMIPDHPVEHEELLTLLKSCHPKYYHMLPRDFTAILTEDIFFSTDQDIAIFQHIRFMPLSWHEHDFFEVAIVLSGAFTHHIVEQSVTLHAGDVLIVAPHTRHAVCTYSEDGIMINILLRASTFKSHFLNVLPDNDLLYNFFVKTLYHSSDMPYLIFKTGKDPQIGTAVENLCREYRRNSRYKNTMVIALLSVFFVILLRSHEKDVIIPSVSPSVMNEETIFILQYMQKNYATITLSHMAEFFNYSERQIQRIIRTATGLSFSENVRKLRMAHAADMMANTDMTLADVAAAVGYQDASNFRKLFRRFYGVSPMEYRANPALVKKADLTILP